MWLLGKSRTVLRHVINNYRLMKAQTSLFFLNIVTWGTQVGHEYMFAFLYFLREYK